MAVQLYNTLTRRKETFAPLGADRVGIYSCGPTVYRDVHIGNLRTYLLADWLRRLLEARGYGVRHVKNITDVGHQRQELLERGEDKVIAAALAEGKTPQQIAQRYTESFLRDEAALNIEPAHVYPKATEHIARMIDVTQRLLERGLAYEVDGTVYFAVDAFPGYGKLSGNTGESLLEGVRGEVDPNKRDPRDFALWKAAEPGREMKWASPWGDGFPGWHIECSAMSTQHLGETFDIHTGGVDNIFPHHEDELAQSEGAFGRQVVRCWVHGQHLLVDGLKMAKSTGNVYTLRDLQARGFEPLAFRYLCATAHYRRRLNFTFDSLRAAAIGLSRLRQEAFRLMEARSQNGGIQSQNTDWDMRFWAALEDDLNVPEALAVLWELLLRSDEPPQLRLHLLERWDLVLGLELLASIPEVPRAVRGMVDEREEARARGDYGAADALRGRIEAAGFEVRDTDAGADLAPALAPPPVLLGVLHSSNDVLSRVGEADEVAFSVVVVGRDDLGGVRRAVESALAHTGADDIEVIVVDSGSSDGTGAWLRGLAARDGRVRPIEADHNLGTGAARNCGIRAARGRCVLLLDTSVEITGDVFTPIGAALDDGPTGIVGAFGVNTENLRDFEDAPGPEVDAVEGYLMAFRRQRVAQVGLMDEKFRFYRHLDLDYSFAFRASGYRNRIIRDLPIGRHAHTDWQRTPEDERERLSKRNFYRFLKKHGDRTDLLLAARQR